MGLDEGRTFIVMRNSVPVGELRPLRRKRFVDAQAVHEIFAAAPPVDWTRFRDDLDDGASQDIVAMSGDFVAGLLRTQKPGVSRC